MDEINLLSLFVSQYLASLAMFKQAVETCPDDLWLDSSPRNKFWHIAYHTMFCTHMYLQNSHAEFRPWAKHQSDSHFLGARPPGSNSAPAIVSPYSKADILEYHEICCAEVRAKVPLLKLEAPSGFHWLPFNKTELQLYNIRHLQHHTGQLADRLRVAKDLGVDWVRAA